MRVRIGRRIAIGVAVSFALFLLLGLANLLSTRAIIDASKKEDLAHTFRSHLYEAAADLAALRSAESALAAEPGPNTVALVQQKAARLREIAPRLTDTIGVDARLLFEASKYGTALKERAAQADAIAAAAGDPANLATTVAAAREMEKKSELDRKLSEMITAMDASIKNLTDRKTRIGANAYKITWAGLFLACIIVVVGGMRITRAVTEPINSLIAGVEKVREEENLSYRIPVISSDETGRLTEEFNRLLDRLETADRRHKELYEVVKNTNVELKEFAYVISHDLKAPLRGIASLASWLSTDHGDKLDEDGKEILKLLAIRVQRMHDLIDGVLQYSRAGRQKEQMVDTDLNRLVEDAIQLVSPPESVKITIANHLPTIFCEPTRITQVFQNLISNAVKYMDKPEGLVKISSEDAGDHWQFAVTDNGPGIDPKYHDKIFQIFQTLRTGEDYDSTGIGLSVVKKIIKLYGGSIWIESELGKGAAFVFRLPKRAFHVMDII